MDFWECVSCVSVDALLAAAKRINWQMMLLGLVKNRCLFHNARDCFCTPVDWVGSIASLLRLLPSTLSLEWTFHIFLFTLFTKIWSILAFIFANILASVGYSILSVLAWSWSIMQIFCLFIFEMVIFCRFISTLWYQIAL